MSKNDLKSIVENVSYYHLESLKDFDKLKVYDYKIIDTILNKIISDINIYKNYKNCLELLLFVFEVVTDNKELFKEEFPDIPINFIYQTIFKKYETLIIGNDIEFENIYTSFNYMLNKFARILKNEVETHIQFSYTIEIIIGLIIRFYYKSINKEKIENFIKYNFPRNLMVMKNKSILHLILNLVLNTELTKELLSLMLKTSSSRRVLNIRNVKNQTPLQLAVLQNRHRDIIQLLLDHGSVVLDLNETHLRYPSLNILQNYVTLQNLAAIVVKKENIQHCLPDYLRQFVDNH